MTMKKTLKCFWQAFHLALLIAWTESTESVDNCGDCYRIDTVTLVGVVLGDILLTIIIILVVYYCTKQSYQKKTAEDDTKVYMNMPVK